VPGLDHGDLLRLLKGAAPAPRRRQAHDLRSGEERFRLHADDSDAQYFPQFWDLAAAFGHGVGRFSSLERHDDRAHHVGRALARFSNVIGSYVVLRQRKDPDLGLVYPSDYVL